MSTEYSESTQSLPTAPTRPTQIWRRDHLLALGLVLLSLVPVVCWPGDVSWLLDEPRLIASAWHSNHQHELATGGLYGNFAIRYGPLPTQIYQALLALTHDPFTLVILRGLFCASITGFSLFWLGRSLALPLWFTVVPLISPHVVSFQRILWDASFTLPFGTLALAALADFLKTGRPWSLRICLAAALIVPMIHPQALPLALPILACLVFFHRGALWRDRHALLVVGAGLMILHGQYLLQAAGQLLNQLGASVEHGYPKGGSHLHAALAPLLGGNLLCGADYLEPLARPIFPAWLHFGAQCCARLIYPFAWIGIVVTALRCWRARRSGSNQPRDGVALVLLAGLIFQGLLFGLMRIPAGPQYFFGTFALQVLVAWFGLDALRGRGAGLWLGSLCGLGATLLTIEGMIAIHRHGFERIGWPTMAASVQIVRSLDSFPDTGAFTNVPIYQRSPQTIRTLRLLLSTGTKVAPRTTVPFLTLPPLPSLREGEPILIEWPADTSAPLNTSPIEVTPLPKNWVPDPALW